MASVGVAIMAHRRRERFVPDLLAALDRPAEVVWDERNDRWHTGRRAMLAYRNHPGHTHWMVVQDDAIVCRDLAAGVEQALEHVPAKSPLCLYVGRVRPFREHVHRLVGRAGPGVSWLAMNNMNWGVGIVMPVELIEPCITWGDRRGDIANYDKRIGRWLQHQGITVYYPWPSLVDHRDSPSLVPGRGSAGRRAHRFIGADVSALDQRWDGRLLSVPDLNNHPGTRVTR